MNKVLIIEDEFHAVKRLQQLLRTAWPEVEILEVLESVEECLKWFSQNQVPDLIFSDIQLADGISFDVFKQVQVECPVIFTTAFDEFAIKAFKLNSIDYLLKPIDPEELGTAIEKYHRLYKDSSSVDSSMVLQTLLKQLQQTDYPERFLIQQAQGLAYINAKEIAYCFTDQGNTWVVTTDGKKYHVDYNLEKMESMLDPKLFFRINRKLIVQLQSIVKVQDYFNHRLILQLKPESNLDQIVSREKVKAFRTWLGA